MTLLDTVYSDGYSWEKVRGGVRFRTGIPLFMVIAEYGLTRPAQSVIKEES